MSQIKDIYIRKKISLFKSGLIQNIDVYQGTQTKND